ncbi:helix-turn-helix domain-containing protein [Brenneria populi subsp. brevivirga]|uniref:helix-turn-helix domain-containing protein n=1 Tax=Brenneria populi TaxID=1505588 RepID=UPI002E173550|nr:helix-turn-helix domain-containing protein [Brenneria populi subsp. brevivirga]
MITLNSKAQLTVDVIAKVAERKITIANAAQLLSKSRRTIERYLQRYRKAIFTLNSSRQRGLSGSHAFSH